MARVILKPQVRGSQVYSSGVHRNHNAQVIPEIESENWYREQAERGGNFASDRNFRDIENLMRDNRAAGL